MEKDGGIVEASRDYWRSTRIPSGMDIAERAIELRGDQGIE
jgi:hypothetical protein